jgi:hypothetical protein
VIFERQSALFRSPCRQMLRRARASWRSCVRVAERWRTARSENRLLARLVDGCHRSAGRVHPPAGRFCRHRGLRSPAWLWPWACRLAIGSATRAASTGRPALARADGRRRNTASSRWHGSCAVPLGVLALKKLCQSRACPSPACPARARRHTN